MAVGMISVLQERIEKMKTFDASYVETLEELQAKAEELSVGFDAEKLSDDKSVRSHIRKRTQKVNNVIARFKRDLAKVIEEAQVDDLQGEE